MCIARGAPDRHTHTHGHIHIINITQYVKTAPWSWKSQSRYSYVSQAREAHWHKLCGFFRLRLASQSGPWSNGPVGLGHQGATDRRAREICLGVSRVRRSLDWSTMYTSVRPQILSHVKSASSSVSRKLIAGVPSQPPCADSYRVCCHESRTKWKAFPVQKLEAVLILGLKN